jgi:hypothetical protein
MNRRRGQSKGNRRGDVFPIRLIPEIRASLEAAMTRTAGPRALGPWLIWAALSASNGPGNAAPARAPGNTRAHEPSGNTPSSEPPVIPCQVDAPLILDLCAGSGAWSEPYRAAGYRVLRVTLPEFDVRSFEPPPDVRGVLAAPPCDQFSLARNGHAPERELARALEPVVAVLRIIATARPAWWALENPQGLLGRWLGPPRDFFEPFHFGDPWTKRTCVWGHFTLPARGPFVIPSGSAMDRPSAESRALTPPGFARAFFEANP